MVTYYDLILVYKIRRDKKPVYLFNKLSRTNYYNTRLMTKNSITPPDTLKTNIAKTSFINRAIKQWNDLPEELHSVNTLDSFKMKVRTWVKQKISV